MADLTILRFPDLFPQENACIDACVEEIKKGIDTNEVQVDPSYRGFFKRKSGSELFWIIARDWQKALRFLEAQKGHEKIFVSVFATASERLTPWETWLRSLSGPWGSHIQWITHSPLSLKFMKDLVGVPEVQLEYLPLPMPQVQKPEKNGAFRVGLFGAFTPESNLHFLLTVAHYLQQKDPSIEIRVMGTGPLYAHLKCLAGDMKLGPQTIIEETKDWHQAALLDCAVFFPHRNDHFSDLLLAGSSEVVPISRNIQGVDEYIKDAYSGFVFDSDDTKSTAETLMTLKNNPLLKSEMAKRFKTALTERYSPIRIADQYLDLWKGQEYRTQNFRRRAL